LGETSNHYTPSRTVSEGGGAAALQADEAGILPLGSVSASRR
jgi:hypothetical protein